MKRYCIYFNYCNYLIFYMRKNLTFIIAALIVCMTFAQRSAAQQLDTLYLSDLYVTHVVFNTELVYAIPSNEDDIVGQIVEQSRNILALRAVTPFETTASVSVLESNGTLRTFILKYRQHPDKLIVNYKTDNRPADGGQSSTNVGVVPAAGAAGNSPGGSVSVMRKADAPKLSEVVGYPQQLYHLCDRRQKVGVLCENIFAYSDITYIVLSLENGSGVSYSTGNPIFVIEELGHARQTIIPEPVTMEIRNRVGGLSAAPGRKERAAYSLDKISLSDNQVLKIYIYEEGGQRNFMLSLTARDVNLAPIPR